MDEFTHNDQPISKPAEDRFGIDPFATAIAKSILKIKSPAGSVIALNGPWGSGKSSAVNLIRHHLLEAAEEGEISIIDFTCWWFRGEEALALAFFRELYAGLSPTLGDKLKQSLPKLGARLLKAGSVLGGAADLAGASGVGAVAGSAMEWIGGLIQQEESVEKLHASLSKELAEQPRRFLVVIDDIDRLSPDEALLIFRLVKSVGRLPNVMYLLVYDRQLAEKIVSERFPSEGPHYLEKIVQAAFELPDPAAVDVRRQLLDQIGAICGEIPDERMLRFMNLFHEGVAPEMRTPRDVSRLINSLAVTWPAVAGEVDTADFVALEVIRLLHPDVYRAVRQRKEMLCGATDRDHGRKEEIAGQYESIFLASCSGEGRERVRRTLMRIFPALEGIWGNTYYSSNQQWSEHRRVCSSTYFDAYFRFSLGTDILSISEINGLIERAGEPDFIKASMREAASTVRPSGGTKAAVFLDELEIHARRVEVANVPLLIKALFEVSDEIDVDADRGGAFTMLDNSLRIHWLIRSLTRDRLSPPERSKAYLSACEVASLGWLADFSDSAWADYHPREGKSPASEEDCLTSLQDAEEIRKILCKRIEENADSGALLTHKDLAYLLYKWRELKGDDGAAVKAWVSHHLKNDESIRRLSIAFTSFSWSQGMGFAGLGDLVAQRTTRAQVKGLDKIMDVPEFRRRVEEVAAATQTPEVVAFLDAWNSKERGREG